MNKRDIGRREFIAKCGTGLAGIIAAGKAPAALVKSLIGAKETGTSKSDTGWENPYVTDGLVAMWDGEWNAGGGVHDSSAKTWKDIIGGVVLTSWNNTAVFDDNSVKYSWWMRDIAGTTTFNVSQNSTLEACYKSLNSSVGNPNSDGGAFLTIGYLGDSYPYSSLTVFNTRNGWINNSSLVSKCKELREFQGITLSSRVTNGGNAVVCYNGNNLYYGQGKNPVDGAINLPANGIVGGGPYSGSHCFRIYSRALTDEEIAYNYAIDKERFGL
jgi:hypothetical protein